VRPLRTEPPALIAIGGFAGSGKSTISRRLSTDLRIPRLGSDTLGRTIRGSAGIKGGEVDAYWIAYDLLFRICEEFVASGVSVILDLTMGYAFQWRHLHDIVKRSSPILFLPVILRCPRQILLERIRQRHAANPEYYALPELFVTEQMLRIAEFLDGLDDPRVHFVDAGRTQDEVHADVKTLVVAQLAKGGLNLRTVDDMASRLIKCP
jgi:predicted kinase